MLSFLGFKTTNPGHPAPQPSPSPDLLAIQAKIAATETSIATLRGLLYISEQHEETAMFYHGRMKLEAYQNKLAFYQTIMAAEKNIDPDVGLLIESYEQQMDSIFFNLERCSYFILRSLQDLKENTNDDKFKYRIDVAQNICRKKIKLQEVVAQLTMFKVVRKLGTTGKKTHRRIIELQQLYRELQDYDAVEMSFEHNNFHITFPVNDIYETILDKTVRLPIHTLLEQLIQLSRHHMTLTEAESVKLIDILACSLARPYNSIKDMATAAAIAAQQKLGLLFLVLLSMPTLI